LIAGTLFIVAVAIQGKKPVKTARDGVVPTPAAPADLANAPRAGEDDAANTPEMDLTPPAQATSALPSAPASSSETTSAPATANLPDLGVGQAEYGQLESHPIWYSNAASCWRPAATGDGL